MKKDSKTDISILRQKAEQQMKKKPSRVSPFNSSVEIQKLIHELEVHQVELEMQNEELVRLNEELNRAKEQAALVNEKYAELYEIGPAGYFTLSAKGEIIDLNLSGAKMLGKKTQHIKNNLFGFFVSDDTRSIFNLFLDKVFKSKARESCKVTLSIDDYMPMYVYIVGIATENGEQCLVTMVNINERLSAEETRKQTEIYGEIGREVFEILNEPGDFQDSIQRVLTTLKTLTNVDAVGIRLKNGEDFPYLAQNGFSNDFLLTENSLTASSDEGGLCKDKDGNVRLECTCGLVISGKTDPGNPLFTIGGSTWTNDSLSNMNIPPSQDLRYNQRNQCTLKGYASIALVPIRNKESIVGLIQLNDRRKGRFTLGTIELLEGIASHIGTALMRKQAEEAQRESEDKFRLLFEGMTEGFALHEIILNEKGEPYDYRFLSINPAFEKLTGLSSENVVGKKVSEVFPFNNKFWIEAYGNVALTRTNIDFECSINELNKFFRVSAFSHKKGYVAVLFENITKRIKAQDALKMSEASLKELNDTKDKFFNIVAHDLKNPFTSLLGSSELLYDNIHLMTNENIRKLALILNDSAKGGYAILQNLLDWSRSQTGLLKFTPEKINLKELINENIFYLQLPAANKEINLYSETEEDIFITGDKNMINTVLRNLLSNALKFTHRHGKVVVIAKKYSDKVIISVEDTGIGISKERIEKLFRIDTKNSIPGTENEQGTGLGLKLCKEFVEKMGCKIRVESTENKGSKFIVSIPLNN